MSGIISRGIKRLVRFIDYRFVPRDHLVVTLDGSGCTMTPMQVVDFIQDAINNGDENEYDVNPTRMTAFAFDRLREFDGW